MSRGRLVGREASDQFEQLLRGWPGVRVDEHHIVTARAAGSQVGGSGEALAGAFQVATSWSAFQQLGH